MKKGDTKRFIKRLLTGDALLGKELISDSSQTYTIIDKIGEGAMGVVYEAHDRNDNGVALKVAIVEQGIQRFRLETAILKLVGKHPNIPELTDWGLDKSDIKFCVMDHVPGQTLRDIINKKVKWFYTQAFLNSIDIAILLLTALNHVHNKKVIHRDIKPSNIIISRMPSGALMLKLMDFGIAKTLEKGFLSFLHRKITFDEKTLTLPGQPIGTLGYAPKEQMDNDSPRESADIFSCGLTIMEVLLSKPLLPSKTISEYMSKIDSFTFEPIVLPEQKDPYVTNEFNRIISKALEKDPKKRYRRAGKMLKDFTNLKKHMEKTKNNPL